MNQNALPTTVRVRVYCAVSGSFNTVPVPSVIVTESLVQVTVVAGPPVEIQVRVFIDNVTLPDIVISPNIIQTCYTAYTHTNNTVYIIIITILKEGQFAHELYRSSHVLMFNSNNKD